MPAHLFTLTALLLVTAVVALVAWALQLMQAANDRKEFSLMLAGCMVCSAAVGLATVMVLTLTGSPMATADLGLAPSEVSFNLESLLVPQTLTLPVDGHL